jgi:hypothetical protein
MEARPAVQPVGEFYAGVLVFWREHINGLPELRVIESGRSLFTADGVTRLA